MAARGGRGGDRGARGGARGGGVNIGGMDLPWDISTLNIEKGPRERYPQHQPSQAPRPTPGEASMVRHYLAVRDRIHDGPFYTVLNDGQKSGLKRKATANAVSETALFNPFTDNQTYTSKYRKVRRRIPKLDTRPYVKDFFPPELHSLLGGPDSDDESKKKRKTLQVATTASSTTKIDHMMAAQGQRLKDAEERGDDADEDLDEDEDSDDEEKPDAVGDEDNWSAVSSDSEESGDDYNAERYFDNGDDDDGDDGDPNENSYE